MRLQIVQMTTPPISASDQLAAVFSRVRLTARVFHTGVLCERVDFPASGAGHLHLFRSGQLDVHGPGSARLTLDRPTALFLPRPEDHRFVVGDEGADLVCAEIDLGGPGNPLESALPALIALPLDPSDMLSGSLGLLFGEAMGHGSGRQVALDRLAEVVLIHLLRRLMETGESDVGLLAGMAHPALSRVLAGLHANPAGSWTLERMADEAGMSRSAFADTFRNVVGTTPGDYLREWRLQLARTGIAAGQPLKRVAAEVGYASPAALSRALGESSSGSLRVLRRLWQE
jgi:AraC-like DNA-binding protein